MGTELAEIPILAKSALEHESVFGIVMDHFEGKSRKNRQHAASVLKVIAEENPQYTVGKINVDDEPELAAAFGISTIPTLVVIKDGKVTNQVSGARPKAALLALLAD